MNERSETRTAEGVSEPSEPMTESMRQVMSLDGDVDKLTAFYADWASYYDADVADHGYGLPDMMLAAVRAAADHDDAAARYLDRSVPVLDAGCGTGLVGQVMYDAGYTELSGIDLSHEMVERARERGIYTTLEGGVDLSTPVPDHLLAKATIVLVGGVFTVGHVPPQALAVVAGLAEPGGLLVVSTRRAYQDETDFVAVQQAMVDDGAPRTPGPSTRRPLHDGLDRRLLGLAGHAEYRGLNR